MDRLKAVPGYLLMGILALTVASDLGTVLRHRLSRPRLLRRRPGAAGPTSAPMTRTAPTPMVTGWAASELHSSSSS